MKGSTYVLAAAALFMAAAVLHNNKNYVANIPAIAQNLSRQVTNCEQTSLKLTVTQRIACVRNVSFADIRKMDMRADNRSFVRGTLKTVMARR